MSWTVLGALVLALSIAVLVLWQLRSAREHLAAGLTEREKARAQGTHRARLQYPVVDLSQCIGCGSCVSACPEDGVLGLVHGQAVVLHGARCVGHGRCADACPVGAIAITARSIKCRNGSTRSEASGACPGRGWCRIPAAGSKPAARIASCEWR